MAINLLMRLWCEIWAWKSHELPPLEVNRGQMNATAISIYCFIAGPKLISASWLRIFSRSDPLTGVVFVHKLLSVAKRRKLGESPADSKADLNRGFRMDHRLTGLNPSTQGLSGLAAKRPEPKAAADATRFNQVNHSPVPLAEADVSRVAQLLQLPACPPSIASRFPRAGSLSGPDWCRCSRPVCSRRILWLQAASHRCRPS